MQRIVETVRRTKPGDLFEIAIDAFEDIQQHDIDELEVLCSDYFVVAPKPTDHIEAPTSSEPYTGPCILHGIRRDIAQSPPRFMSIPHNALLKKRRRFLIYIVANSEETFAEAQRVFAKHTWARVIHIPTTFYLESIMYLNILPRVHHEWRHVDLVGAVAWSAHTKQPLIFKADTICEEAMAHGADVVTFLHRGDPLIQTAEKWHPGFEKLWCGLMQTFGWYEEVYMSTSIPSFYANYWATTPALMKRYCAFASDVAHRLDTRKDLTALLWRDASYSARGNDIAKLSAAECMRIWGTPFYTFHPFLFERLPCYWFWLYGKRTTGIR